MKEGMDLAGTKAEAVAAADGQEGSDGEEEEQYVATGRNRRHGVNSSALNTLEVQSLVFQWLLLWDWKSTTQI